jgi:hypothetical protein
VEEKKQNNKENEVVIVEREINLSLINDKLNYIIKKIDGEI